MFSCPFGLDVDGIVRVGDRLASINVAPGTMRVIPGIRFLIASLVPTFVPQTYLLLHHLQPRLFNRLVYQPVVYYSTEECEVHHSPTLFRDFIR